MQLTGRTRHVPVRTGLWPWRRTRLVLQVEFTYREPVICGTHLTDHRDAFVWRDATVALVTTLHADGSHVVALTDRRAAA